MDTGCCMWFHGAIVICTYVAAVLVFALLFSRVGYETYEYWTAVDESAPTIQTKKPVAAPPPPIAARTRRRSAKR